MSVDELVSYFGSPTKAARALGVKQSAVSNWRARNRVSEAAQLRAEKISRGRLKAA